MKIKLGFEQAKFTQEYQMMASIVSHAFGGKKSKPPEAKTFEEAELQFAAVFGG